MPKIRFDQEAQQEAAKLLVKVVDENQIAIKGARVRLVQGGTLSVLKGETDFTGQYEFVGLTPGHYQVQVEKKGFYTLIRDKVRVSGSASLEITLNHYQEIADVVDVVYSPPSIDPTKTASRESLDAEEILNLPYPTTRDIRNALRFFPGMVQDNSGQVHLNGSASYQILNQLDGFNITHPVSGLLQLRFSPDAVRSIHVLGGRYSAEYGKGSGGVLGFETGMGDDHYRFSATNFIPDFQSRDGIHLNTWTPRVNFSGPLRKERAWFFVSLQGEYNLDIVRELPPGADQNRSWRWNNLSKLQINLSPSNILTTSFLTNSFHSDHAGLSRFDPLETSRDRKERAYLFTLKDQLYLSGTLLEVGFAVNEFRTDEQPLGDSPYRIHPGGTSGNFFKQSREQNRRLQWISNLTFPTTQWQGRHEFKVGADIDRITLDQSVERRPILILRGDDTLSRKTTFIGSSDIVRNNWELALFAQDRWSLSDRLLVELGLRLDWDAIIRQPLVSPRFASSYLLNGETKIMAGLGIFYDATNLAIIGRPSAGQRFDVFYAGDGQSPLQPPIETGFVVKESTLRAPRFFNWSVGLEQELAASIYLSAEFQQKRGRDGFTFIPRRVDPSSPLTIFELHNLGKDRYNAIQVTLRRTFKGESTFFASYTRSKSRSNSVLDFDIDNPFFGPQAGGPLPWDTPNRLISWGWLPLLKSFKLAYSLEWRDGYPFSLVNEDQELVGPPNSRRFPAYFSLNVHVERRIHLLGRHWAVRGGFNNLTGRENATVVNNNVDSPGFLTLGAVQGRALVFRLRLLGRN
ncbi:TonB-dependent receptor [Acidobacteria bacterium AH-259-L09]|nr:TonB-dependent receptor [Acidobacteria bacterium AH-259-L09]